MTEHRAESKICTCGHNTTAKFPQNVTAPVQYGDRVKALSVYFTNQQLIPEKRLCETFKDVFSLPISEASIEKFSISFSENIKFYQNSVLQWLKKTDVKHLDETGLRISGKTKCFTSVFL